ncbi:unnamed protein product [Prorocentrum cordatum]|uniref:Sulfatase N-terminal domain-containing protein n=1 Tax=Prorocentrum cordatum TaxID=2364126 RepID=A0ABN9XX71_9DINO|nr:unnamed protein product [Polarella glacialis]
MAALILAFVAVVLRCAGAARPNVVLLVFDDLGWADVGYHGGNFPTPNIDRLASDGVKLERMYVMPQCSPTRAAIMTGRYSFRTGLQHFETIMPGSSPGLPDDSKTLAQVFQDAGYATHMIGKWHLGYSMWSQSPLGKGFDTFYGYMQGQVDYYNRTIPTCGPNLCVYPLNRPFSSKFGPAADGYDFWDGRTPVTEDFGKYTVDKYEARLDEVLCPYGGTSPPSKPFFLYFAEQQVHIPLQAPPDARHMEACSGVVGGTRSVNRTVLCSMASRLDESVGRLEALLKKNGVWNETLIFAVADNGGMTQWSPDWPASASSNWPLRGGKTTLFEGGVRVPAFLSGGALPTAARGRTSEQLLHATDILPTLAGFAGIPVPSRHDGVDAWSAVVHGGTPCRTEIPLNIGRNPLGGLPWLVTRLAHDGATNYSALISWPWKVLVGAPYIEFGTLLPTRAKESRRDGYWGVEPYNYTAPDEDLDLPVRLYNLEQDEAEHHNLANSSEYQVVLKKLVSRVEWYASKDNGWVQPQSNVPWQRANPMFHSWTWAPFRSGPADTLDEVEASEDVAVVV